MQLGRSLVVAPRSAGKYLRLLRVMGRIFLLSNAPQRALASGDRRADPRSMAPASLVTALALLFASAAFADNQPHKAAIIEHIIDGSEVSVQRGESTLSLHRGEDLYEGDSLITDNQTVYIKLARHNEIQLTPHSELVMERVGIGKTDDDSTSSLITLKKGILWGLLANGMSMGTPFTVRTDELAVDVSSANLVVERAEGKKTTTLLSLEGTLKYGVNTTELRNTKAARYVNAGFRISSEEDGKISPPKRFKRHLLLAYLGKKAKATSKDISNRGFRALSSIMRKDAAETTEEQITWNLPPGVGVPQNNAGGAGPHGMPSR